MPKNIVYQTKQNGKNVVGYSKETKLLRTNLDNGETCDWIPEDETILIPKVISKDGVYKASEEPGNIYGYSEVTVQGIGTKIMGDLGVITISKNGTYYAKTAYKPSELGSSSSSDDSEENKIGPFYGYKTVIVNVSGGSSDYSGSGTTSNSVTGKDSDGNEVRWSTDSAGILRKSFLPSRISVTTEPKFTTYRNGDKLNYSGIKVTVYTPTGIYKSDKVPTGILTKNDLILSVTTARGGGGNTVEIPVKWKRPEDNKTLSTTFSIKVNDA